MAEWKEDWHRTIDGARLRIHIAKRSLPGERTILFSPGISAVSEDYHHLLDPLANAYNIIAVDHRGHGESGGRFSPEDVVVDAMELQQRFDSSYLLGHGSGCLAAEGTEAAFMINPYFGPDFLSQKRQKQMKFAAALARWGLAEGIERILAKTGLGIRNGFHDKHMIQDYVTLGDDLSTYLPETHAGIMVADNDEILGTRGNPEVYRTIKSRLSSIFPNWIDYSLVVEGLNGCLNMEKDDLVPFMHPEEGKDSSMIIETISSFYEQSRIQS